MFVQRHLEYAAQLPFGEWLEDVAEWLGEFGAGQEVIGSKRREEDHRHRVLRADHFRCGYAIHGTRQLDIHQHQIRPPLADHGNGLLAPGGVARRFIAHLQQLQLDVAGDDGLVFHDQYPGLVHQCRH